MTKRKAAVSFFIIGLVLLFMYYPIQQLQAARATGTVKNRILNVRSSASTSSSIVCKLSKGAKVTIISETTGDDGLKWYNVYFAHDGGTAEGYVRADLVNVSGTVSSGTTSNNNDDSSSGDTLYVNKASVRVRKSAMIGSEIVAGLTKGAEVTSKGTTTGSDGSKWTKVSFKKDGEKITGYIRSDLLTSKKPSSSDSSSSSDSEYLYVSASSVHVRSAANPSSDSVAGLSKGAEVKVKSKKTGTDGRQWTKVSFTQDGSKIQGYIRSDLLTTEKPAGSSNNNNNNSSSSDSDIVYVSASAVRVRAHASNSADVVANLLKGDKVKVKSTKTGSDGKSWTKVSFTINGTKYHGYIRSDYLSKKKPSDEDSSSSQSSNNNNNNTDTPSSGTVRLAIINLRESATTSSSIVAKISQGTKMTITSETTGSDGKKWYKVSCKHNGSTVKGYVRSDLLNL